MATSSSCCSSQTQCKIIAVLDLIFTVLMLIGTISSWNRLEAKIFWSAVLLELILAATQMVLYIGATDRNLRKIQIWLVVTAVFYILVVLGTFLKLFQAPTEFLKTLLVNVIVVLIHLFMMFLVRRFIMELKRGQRAVESSSKV